MTIKIYINSSWVDITSSVDVNSIVIQSRCDEAFATGSLNAWIEREDSYASSLWITYNIPPYTPMLINNVYYVCQSTCNKDLTHFGLYIHNFELMESTSVLSTILIGTKYFSITGTNTKDYEKINILKELVNDKIQSNGGSITITAGYASVFTEKIEYSFGAGSTLYDCFNEIAKHYNYRVYVNSFSFGAITGLNYPKISVQFIPIYTTNTITSSEILSVAYSQNSDKYSATLETEAQNVVDRTTPNEFRMLTCRAEDILFTADTAQIELPSNVESITDFGIESVTRLLTWGMDGKYYNSAGTQLIGNYQISQFYESSAHIQRAYTLFFAKYYPNISNFKSLWCTIYDDESGTGLVCTNGIQGQANQVKESQSLINWLMEKAKWDLLTPDEQCQYAVYDTGKNVIYNLNAEYKSGTWETILGQRGHSILEHTFPEISDTLSITTSGETRTLSYKLHADSSHSSNPLSYQYYVKYYPIGNLYLYDEKADDAYNETYYKKLARSYNVNSSMIDFDKVVDNMSITNSSEGKPELSIEVVSASTMRRARSKFTYDGKLWYVISVVNQYSNGKIVSTLNCVMNYNKSADCISVDSQYSSTKNDLSIVVDRPIFTFGIVSSSTFTTMKNTPLYFELSFKVGYSELYYGTLRASKFIKDDVMYLYCEMLDQSNIGKYVDVYSETEVKYLKYLRYTDDKNEIDAVGLKIVALPYLTDSQSYSIPNVHITSASQRVVYFSKDILLHKDARERLTFTVKITK